MICKHIFFENFLKTKVGQNFLKVILFKPLPRYHQLWYPKKNNINTFYMHRSWPIFRVQHTYKKHCISEVIFFNLFVYINGFRQNSLFQQGLKGMKTSKNPSFLIFLLKGNCLNMKVSLNLLESPACVSQSLKLYNFQQILVTFGSFVLFFNIICRTQNLD